MGCAVEPSGSSDRLSDRVVIWPWAGTDGVRSWIVTRGNGRGISKLRIRAIYPTVGIHNIDMYHFTHCRGIKSVHKRAELEKTCFGGVVRLLVTYLLISYWSFASCDFMACGGSLTRDFCGTITTQYM